MPGGPYPNPRDHAILIGIQHYDASIPSLKGSIKDCELFRSWLERPDGGGLDPAHIAVRQSVNPNIGEPYTDQIKALLIGYFTRSFNPANEPGRRLYLYFSGHGVSPPVPLDEDCGLVMANSTSFMVQALPGGMSARTIRKAALFEEVVLVMDCCREVTGAHLSVLHELIAFQEDATKPPRPYFHVLAARWNSTAAEQNLPDPFDAGLGMSWHGVLTHALIRGLLTAPDAQGNVTAASLEDFLKRAVETMMGAKTFRPKTDWDDTLDPMHFGNSDGVPVVVRLSNGAARFRVLHGEGLAPVTPKQRPVPGGTKVWLVPGLYLLEAVDAAGAVTASLDCKVLEADLDVTL